MKHAALLLVFLMLILLRPDLSAQKKLSILHTNDLHASLLGEGYQEGEEGSGGFSRIATQIKKEKTLADNPVIVVDAGDFTMGSLFQILEPETGFQLKLMKQMGYDAVSIGNHEFDFGVETLGKYLRNVSQLGIPQLVLSNISVQDDLTELYADSIIKTYEILELDGLRVGIFGLLGDNAYEYSPKLTDYPLLDRIRTARKIVNILQKQEHADFIICLSHSGVFKDDNGNWKKSEDLELAQKVDGIDAIISAHTHTKLDEPIIVNGTPIVQALTQGKFLGKLTLEKGAPEKLSYELIPIDQQISPDPVIDSLIGIQFSKLKKHLKESAGLNYDKVYFESEFPLIHNEDIPEQTSIGNFIADAMYYAVNEFDQQGTDIAMIAQGMIRCGIKPGKQSLTEIFQVASLGEGNDQLPGYSLSKLYFTAHELKVVLELLHVVAAKDPGYFCFAGGIQIQYKDKGGIFNKIAEIRIMDKNASWQTLDYSGKNEKLYSVTADSYMMAFLTVLKKKSFGLVNVKPKLASGERVEDFNMTLIDMDPEQLGIQEGKVWGSMLRYASSFEDKDGDGIPEIPEKYRSVPGE
ncbi:MAG: bifunctional metallophosphatase/5'-nucleotidase [Bacteroidales bacterium]|nr:bifunctional metallophosphatase/5'-nucleotidase [Bacteroidales bacterium]